MHLVPKKKEWFYSDWSINNKRQIMMTQDPESLGTKWEETSPEFRKSTNATKTYTKPIHPIQFCKEDTELAMYIREWVVSHICMHTGYPPRYGYIVSVISCEYHKNAFDEHMTFKTKFSSGSVMINISGK